MHEKMKYEEAIFFYSKMRETPGRKEFRYYLSAFLSAARSILQYSMEEGKSKPDWQRWYEDKMNSEIMKYFRDKRNFNIHTAPLPQNITLVINETLSVEESLTIIKRNEDKLTVEFEKEVKNNNQPSKGSESKGANVDIIHRFGDWKGNEDVLTLSEKYLVELENYIEEGVNKKFFSG